MLIGAHSILYSNDVEKDRNFLRDVLKLPHIDIGGNWLIFGLPPSEIALHHVATDSPLVGAASTVGLYFLVDDIEKFCTELDQTSGASTSKIDDQGWGKLITLTLPSGTTVGVYEPRHARPPNALLSKRSLTDANDEHTPKKAKAGADNE